jgi:hypothetical protein
MGPRISTDNSQTYQLQVTIYILHFLLDNDTTHTYTSSHTKQTHLEILNKMDGRPATGTPAAAT